MLLGFPLNSGEKVGQVEKSLNKISKTSINCHKSHQKLYNVYQRNKNNVNFSLCCIEHFYFFSSNIFYYSQFSFRLSICMNSIFYPHLFHIFCYPHFHLFTHYFAKYSNLFSDQFSIYFVFLKIVLDFAKKYHPFYFYCNSVSTLQKSVVGVILISLRYFVIFPYLTMPHELSMLFFAKHPFFGVCVCVFSCGKSIERTCSTSFWLVLS